MNTGNLIFKINKNDENSAPASIMKSKVSTVNPIFVAGYTFRGSNSPTFIFASCFISRITKLVSLLKKWYRTMASQTLENYLILWPSEAL